MHLVLHQCKNRNKNLFQVKTFFDINTELVDI